MPDRRAPAAAIAAFACLFALAASAAESDLGYRAFHNRNYCRILHFLQVLYRQPLGSKHRFLVADPGRRTGEYVQCLIAPDRTGALCEAASGKWLQPAQPLVDGPRLATLGALGFALDPGDGNYQLTRPISAETDLRGVAELYLQVFYDVYEAPANTDLVLTVPRGLRLPTIEDSADPDCLPAIS